MWQILASWALVLAQVPPHLTKLFAYRDIRSKVDSCIVGLESFLAKNSSSQEGWVMLSRSYYMRGENELYEDKKLSWYQKGFDAAQKALKLSFPQWSQEKEEQLLTQLGRAELPGLYWSAANLARWLRHASLTQRIRNRKRVLAYWNAVGRIQADYFHGGYYRFYGGYRAMVPSFTGDRDLKKSKENFEKAIAVSSRYLETKVLYAELYAAHPDVKDKELFQELLNEVLKAPVGDDMDIAAENRLAQLKARSLLQKTAQIFK